MTKTVETDHERGRSRVGLPGDVVACAPGRIIRSGVDAHKWISIPGASIARSQGLTLFGQACIQGSASHGQLADCMMPQCGDHP